MKEDWKSLTMGDIADITDYVSNGSFASLRENVSYKSEKDYAVFVRLADFSNGFDESKFVFIDKHSYDYLSKSSLFGGEIIMSNVGSVGKLFICPDLGMPMSLAPNSIVIKTNYNRFYYYLLSSHHYQSLILGITSKTALPKFNKTSFKKIPVIIPTIQEQEHIVSELDLLSGIIDKQKAQLRELDNLAQSIFYDMFGDPVKNEKGWDVKKLGDVCLIERGGSPRPIDQYLTDDINGINWIKIGDATDGGMVITSTKQRIKPEGANKSRFVHKGDFLLSNSMSFGKPYILGVDGCIHDGWLVIRDEHHTFDKIYLYHLLGSPQTYEAFKGLAVGGVVNNLNKDSVKKVFVVIPPMNLQKSFAAKIESIESQKSSINKSITETQKLFDYTMDKYFG